MTNWRTGAAAAVLSVVVAACVAACGSGDEKSPATTGSASAEESGKAAAKDDSTADAPSGDYLLADGANPINTTGKPLFSLSEAGLRIDAYEAGRTKAAVDSDYVDFDTDENMWPAGSDVVYVTYVLTNTSDKTVYISDGAWSTNLTIKSMPYAGGVGDITPFDAAEASSLGVFDHAFANFEGGINDHPALPAGASVAASTALPLKKGEACTFSVTVMTYPSATTTKITEGDSVSFGETSYTFK